MMQRLTVMMVLALATTAFGLEIGDKAPALRVAKWIVGGPATPDKPDGKTVYVVEFWATWCPPCLRSVPHLIKLQDRLKDRGVVVVGISDEDPQTVEAFARRMKMTYTVGIDDDHATSNAWMAGVSGIPHAFVVNKDGVIVWSGHPLMGLDDVLEQVLAGAYDAEHSKRVARAKAQLEKAGEAADLDQALAALDELIKLEPTEYAHVAMKVEALRAKRDPDGILRTRQAAAQAFARAPVALNNLAWEIATDSDLATRDPLLAFTCAQEAVKLNERKDAASLDTLARAFFSLCLLDDALTVEKEALAVCRDDEERESLSAALRYYEQVKATQEVIREKK